MQSKTLSKRTLVVGIIAGLILPLSFFFNAFWQNNSARIIESSTIVSAQKQVGYGLPMRLKIPKIDVDSKVEYVGLASDGSIGVPKDRDNVAWFEFGQRPGDIGGAVIVGHYGINNKKTSVFDNLYRLRVGDKLFVEDDRGATIAFVVREIIRYDPEADSSVAFGPNDGKAHLNLITCEGVWDEKTQQYPKRLIVSTDKEE